MNIDIDKLAGYFRTKGPVILLESQSKQHHWSRHTYLAALPKVEIWGRGNQITIQGERDKQVVTANPWDFLREYHQSQKSWLFGYLGYDLKNHIEELQSFNSDAIGASDFYFMIPQFLLLVDERNQNYQLLLGKLPDAGSVGNANETELSCTLRELKPAIQKDIYRKQIGKAQQRIFEGDIYEVNLSHQLRAEFGGSPWALYQKMKTSGPVPFGAFLENEEVAVCCQSPERFLRKEGRKIISQPIKGTRRRSYNLKEDIELQESLLISQKDRAENLMIVDLVRNDLSRIARAGSVEVPELFGIESYDTVHQMVSTITAEACLDDPFAILKACFPMGSMTGTPKIRAMKIIEELEDYRRGIYSGAIGYITPQQDFDFNVVIRSALVKDDSIFYSAGGAITSDSDPVEEWEETLVKTKALSAAMTQ